MTLRAVAGGTSGLTVGSTVITSGTDKRILFDDNGVVGEDADLVWNKTLNKLYVGIVSPAVANYTVWGDGTNTWINAVSGGYAHIGAGDNWGLLVSENKAQFNTSLLVGWGSAGSSGAMDTGIARNGAGVTEFNNGTAGTLRDVTLRTIVGTGGVSAAVVKKTSTYTALVTDYTIIVDATSGAVTINLPAATASGRIYNIKKIDASANNVTADGNASETIDGATTKVLSAQWSSMQIQDTESGKWSVL